MTGDVLYTTISTLEEALRDSRRHMQYLKDKDDEDYEEAVSRVNALHDAIGYFKRMRMAESTLLTPN